MLPRKTFIYFLLDTPTGKVYYRDNTGTLKIQIIAAGTTDVSLRNAPANWLDTELGYDRNNTYNGIQRSFSTPMDFVRDALQMIKELFLLGYGTEEPLSLAVYKYNSQPVTGEPTYKLYFKSNIDLSTISETVLETLSTSLMEGGVLQLLKSYEGTTLQIPCDGSIVENQKINFDGALVQDTFYYIVNPIRDFEVALSKPTVYSPLGMNYINNEGDNYGVIHQNQTLEMIAYNEIVINPAHITDYAKSSQNFLFLSTSKITLKVSGIVNILYNNACDIQFFYVTSSGQLIPATDLTTNGHGKIVNFALSAEINLAKNESLFLMMYVFKEDWGTVFLNNMFDILGGNFQISFNSQAITTRAWGVSFSDLFKLILAKINLLSSTQTQVFNYVATSALLEKYSNLFAIAGDSLRASGDSTYQRFYSLSQTNQVLQQSYGPVIKINLKDFYQSIEAILCAEMQSDKDNLSIETIDSIYDSGKIDMELGEIASLKWSFAKDKAFSDFEIGYQPQTYDQKAGKYEWNTTLAMKAPINAFQKKVSKISKIRFDSYGIEKLRSNTGEATSTTRNDSDNSVFGANVDLNNWIPDFFNANFASVNQNPDDSLNTNINFYQTYNVHQQNIPSQPINIPITDGDWFQPNQDQAIIIFTGAFPSQSGILTLTGGNINSVNKPPLAPTDKFTIKLWHNGVMIYSYTTVVSSVNTPIALVAGGTGSSFPYSFTESFSIKDSFYISMETSDTCVADSITGTLSFPGSTILLSFVNVPVGPGTSQKLLSYSTLIPLNNPYAVSTSFIQYGFQYFTFVSQALNTNFSMIAGFQGYISGDTGNFEIDVYVNGVLQSENIIIAGSVSRIKFASSLSLLARNYAVNDIVFFTASVGSGNMNASLFSCNVTFNNTQVKAYSLKRVQYDYLSGIPNIAKNNAGEIRSDIPGAPYNIEDVTPKLMYARWKNYIVSTFLDKVTGDMIFQSLSKNQYLQRSYAGQTIIESSNETVLDATRLFYPISIEVKTNVPLGFAELMAKTKNAHIHCTFMGTDIYFFADSLKQKPALNESQVWKGTLSPKTDLINFVKINSFKIPDMSDNSIYCAFASPLQFVPYNSTLLSKYHTYNRNEFLFVQQTGLWENKNSYWQPVQIGDPLPLQFITRGLSPVSYTVFNCDGSVYLGPINLDSITSPAVSDPYMLWQKVIDTTGWPIGNYYLMINAGAGSLAAILISEPLAVRSADQMTYTVLMEYSNSFNSQGIVFDSGFVGSMRVPGGFNNMFKQKYLGKFYIDQPQDITILNAIAYEITQFFLFPVPDYVAKKVLRALIMDGCALDGEGFTLNEGAQFEETFTEGSPFKMQKVDIRPSKNMDGISMIAAGVDSDSSLIVSVSQSFGPNISNESEVTETDLIQITVGN